MAEDAVGGRAAFEHTESACESAKPGEIARSARRITEFASRCARSASGDTSSTARHKSAAEKQRIWR